MNFCKIKLENKLFCDGDGDNYSDYVVQFRLVQGWSVQSCSVQWCSVQCS